MRNTIRLECFPVMARALGAIGAASVYWIGGAPRIPLGDGLILMIVLGIGLVLARYSVTIDGSTCRITDRVGLFVPFVRVRDHEFARYDLISIDLEVTQNERNRSLLSYRVAASGPGVRRDISEHSDFARARARAKQVAKLMGIGMRDGVMGSGHRDAGYLDETLRNRILREGSLTTLPPVPNGFSMVSNSGELQVALPRARLLPQLGVALWWCAFVALTSVTIIMRLVGAGRDLTGVPASVANVAVALCAVISLFGFMMILKELAGVERETTVRVGPLGLAVNTQGPFGTRSKAISSAALESIGVGKRVVLSTVQALGPERIVVVADDAIVTFGIGCTPYQRDWLIQAIQHALVADVNAQPSAYALRASA